MKTAKDGSFFLGCLALAVKQRAVSTNKALELVSSLFFITARAGSGVHVYPPDCELPEWVSALRSLWVIMIAKKNLFWFDIAECQLCLALLPVPQHYHCLCQRRQPQTLDQADIQEAGAAGGGLS